LANGECIMFKCVQIIGLCAKYCELRCMF